VTSTVRVSPCGNVPAASDETTAVKRFPDQPVISSVTVGAARAAMSAFVA
jgi:hypothetical protein